MKHKINWLQLIGLVVLVNLIGNIGSLATFSQIDTWYKLLEKPSFNPPAWVFGPAWTTLFTLMGIALYLVWQSKAKSEQKKLAFKIFAVQMVLNVAWSFIFFGAHNLYYGLIEIVVLWLAILATIITFYRINRTAGIILLPYLGWVTFATLLTYSIWRLN